MNSLQKSVFLIAISLLNVTHAASVAYQFEFLSGKAFFSTNGEKVSFGNGEFVWNKNLADSEPAAITGSYLRGAEAVLLQAGNSSEPLSVRVEPATGQLVLNGVTYSWGGGCRDPATPAPPVGNSDDLNEQFGYLSGKAFLAASNRGTYLFENGQFRFFTAVDNFTGQYRIQEGSIRLIPDDNSRKTITVTVNMGNNTITDQGSGLIHQWGVAYADPSPSPTPAPIPAPPPPVSDSPFLVSVEEQYAFLAGKAFSNTSGWYADRLFFNRDGGFSWGDGQITGSGKYYVDNGVIYLDFSGAGDANRGTDIPIPVQVFPATQSILFKPDSSLRGIHAVQSDSPFFQASTEDLRGKLFRGTSGSIAFTSVGNLVELLDYASSSDPFFGALTTELDSRSGLLAISGKLDDGTRTLSSIFFDKSTNKLIVNGREYVWLGELSTDYGEQVTKPNAGWLSGKTFASANGSKLTIEGGSYSLLSSDGKTDSGSYLPGIAVVYLHHNFVDAFPLEVDVNGRSVIYKGETFHLL